MTETDTVRVQNTRLLETIIHAFMFSDCFILVSVMVDREPYNNQWNDSVEFSTSWFHLPAEAIHNPGPYKPRNGFHSWKVSIQRGVQKNTTEHCKCRHQQVEKIGHHRDITKKKHHLKTEKILHIWSGMVRQKFFLMRTNEKSRLTLINPDYDLTGPI